MSTNGRDEGELGFTMESGDVLSWVLTPVG
jgi:hypothetical protein